MNMNKTIFFLVVAVLGFSLGCQMEVVLHEEVAVKKENQPAFEYPSSPEGVVAAFSEHFIHSVSKLEKGVESSRIAYNMLSGEAKDELGQVKAGLSNRLIIFSGVRQVPDLGFHILGVIERTDDHALVEAYWEYLNDTLENANKVKTFALVKENTNWKISMIN
jgi:hypothetical protein